MRKILVVFAATVFVCAIARAQDDAPSLGDVARQARAQKQQKDAQSKDSSAKDATKDAANGSASSNDASAKDQAQPKTPHVITNEELPEHTGSSAAAHHASSDDADDAGSEPMTGNRDQQAERWKSQIQAQKSAIASLQQQITELSNSIHYTGANCVANCAQWNERQQQKQQQVDSMKSQLEEAQRHLEEMQDAARKQGFGSSVYEP